MSLVSPKFGIRPRLQRIQGSGLASPGCLTQPLCDCMSTDGLLIGSIKSSLSGALRIAFRITKEINEKKAHYCTWCHKRRFSRNVCELYRIWASLVRLFFSFHIVASIAEWYFFKIYRRIIQNLWYFQYWEVELLKCPLFIGNKKKKEKAIWYIKYQTPVTVLLWRDFTTDVSACERKDRKLWSYSHPKYQKPSNILLHFLMVPYFHSWKVLYEF